MMLQFKYLVRLFSLLAIFSFTIPAAGQDYTFTEGLRLKLSGFGRSGVGANPVEKALVLGQWQPPKEGDSVVFGEQKLEWIKLNAAEDGWFSDDSIRGAYVYSSFESDRDRIMLLVENGNDLVYVNGILRAGNRYGFKKEYNDWEPRFDFVTIPVELKKGRNHFMFFNTRTGRLHAQLLEPKAEVLINAQDPTLPDFIVGENIDTWVGVVLINATKNTFRDGKIISRIGENEQQETAIPVIQPLSVRKIPFKIKGNACESAGRVNIDLEVVSSSGKVLDRNQLTTNVKQASETHRRTFVSKIDGSVQYYAVNPASSENPAPKALVLSVHGANVEAINQAGSYFSKSWAHIVAPTNRRPYGFSWEDWGRSDALEVLDIARESLNVDPDRIYLTGHSMGGHGTWHLGATFPDLFAAIGPSAGWISFWSYGVRGEREQDTPMQEMLKRATMPSRTMEIAENYKQLGVYVIHGDKDESVPVGQSRMMVERLKTFHKDFQYHEESGQGHWWDLSDEPGADCVDWAPLFDFFARHARPGKERIRRIEFVTANPGVSASNNWLSIEAQLNQLKLSKVDIQVDPGSARFVGSTENVAVLSLDLSVLPEGNSLSVEIDGQKIENIDRPPAEDRLWLAQNNGRWQVRAKPALSQKGPHRYGTFKEAFNNRFIFVYGTQGNREENQWAFEKARYDAEHFWYQGNGSVDVIPDTEFDPAAEPDRNVIVYGNARTNSAWTALLGHSPVQVTRGQIKIGTKTVKGNDLACLFIRPRPGSDIASVGVVSGSGIVGMRLTNRSPYMSPGFAYPDVTVFNPEILSDQTAGYVAAGFFGLDWSVENGEIIWHKN